MTTTAAPPAPPAETPIAPTPPEVPDDDRRRRVAAGALELVRVLGTIGRHDLAGRMNAARARLDRPASIVAVVGEFKQGKSSLVNGLLGRPVCPVDDDLATSAITLVRHADEPSAIVRRVEDGQRVAARVGVDELPDWVSEVGNPGNEKGVERVEIGVPSALLRQGLTIVDTPGMGGLGAGHAAATLAFLPYADGLVLASDASAELSAPEIEMLVRATELCPTVLFAQTKIDLYPEWERVLELNRGHLDRAGVRIPMVGVSTHLRIAALRHKRRDLNDASRFPSLLDTLHERVVEPARSAAVERSARDVVSAADMVAAGLRREAESVSDPAALQSSIAEIERVNERLAHLRGPAARWSTHLNDRVADLTTATTHQLRSSMRTVGRDMEAEIEGLTKGDEWDHLARRLQGRVADAVARCFVAVEEGRRSIRAQTVELIQEENLDLGGSTSATGSGYDVAELWRDKDIDADGRGAKAGLKTAITGARGAQGGVLMFGMMGNFLPGAAAAFLATNPVLLGAGALFGGMQLMEDRKRKVTQRRQNARQQVRQFVDDVQFDVTNELTNQVREIQRELRDEFTERLAELQRTYTTTGEQARAAAQRTQADQQARRAEIDEQLALLDRIMAHVRGAAGS